MYLLTSRKKNSCNFYLAECYRTPEGKPRSRIVTKIGSEVEIKEKYGVEDAKAWATEFVQRKNEELRAQAAAYPREITITLKEQNKKQPKLETFNAGYLILEKLYYQFGFSNICEEIQHKHPHIKGFNLDNVLRVMLLGRIINPSSKLGLIEQVQQTLLEQSEVKIQHVYRAMDLLSEHSELIQDRLFEYSSLALGERNVSRLYYDCTNFFTEKELEDCDLANKSEQWQQEHLLRKYGKSKENRPNPIVQLGMFMDGDGMPLGFCVNPGNTNEQKSMRPLEEKILKNFALTDVVVCTDAGLASFDNRLYNNKRLEDDPLVQFKLSGERRFVCTQSIKGLKSHLKEWALDPAGWSYDKRTDGRIVQVNDFNLSSITEDNSWEFSDVTFYKERTIAERGLDQRLIMSFSLKYRDFHRRLRERRIKRAEKMICNGSYEHESENSPRSLITRTHTTADGETATRTSAALNQEKIDNDSQYDGFYCLATNLFKHECTARQVVAISNRRWEIEECFRIMKSNLKARPFYHSKDCRIEAHFMTCFMALMLIRGIERCIAEKAVDNPKYPNGKYTVNELLTALRSIQVTSLAEGRAYKPSYENSEMITELLEVFELNELGQEVVMKESLNKILKKIKTSPEIHKEEKKA